MKNMRLDPIIRMVVVGFSSRLQALPARKEQCFMSKKFLCLLAVTAGLLVTFSSTPAHADSFSNFSLVIQTAFSTESGWVQQRRSTDVPGALIQLTSTITGVDSDGRTYSGSQMVEGDAAGVNIFASSSLSGGNGAGPTFNARSFGIYGFSFQVPSGVYGVSASVYADDRGTSATGYGYTDGWVRVGFDDNYDNYWDCSFGSGSQSCSLQIQPASPGSFATFWFDASIYAASYFRGDSATMNYRFTPALDYYDANGNLVGQFNFSATSSATPEPSTLLMLSSGVLGIAGLVRRKLS